MKIALIISGFIRTWEQSKPSLKKNLLKNIDYDLFAHVYNQNYFEYSSGKKDVYYSDEQILGMFDDVNLKKIFIEDREKVVSKIEIESKKYENINNYKIPIKESSEQNDNYVHTGIRIYDQLRKNHLCNLLRKEYELETGTKYDLVVKTRFDTLYLDEANWDSYTDPKKIYIGHGGCLGFPDDILGIGLPKAMDEGYFSRFENLDKLCFSEVNKIDSKWVNWYSCWGEKILPIKEFCSHDTLLRNSVYNGYDLEAAHVGIRIIRNENQIKNWHDCYIGNVYVTGNSEYNSIFDVNSFNRSINYTFDVNSFNRSIN